MKEKKIPMRMCVVCRNMKPKSQLIRLVLTDEGAKVDLTGKTAGRGVYVCRDAVCIRKSAKNKNFAKQHGFSLTEDLIREMEKGIEE